MMRKLDAIISDVSAYKSTFGTQSWFCFCQDLVELRIGMNTKLIFYNVDRIYNLWQEINNGKCETKQAYQMAAPSRRLCLQTMINKFFSNLLAHVLALSTMCLHHAPSTAVGSLRQKSVCGQIVPSIPSSFLATTVVEEVLTFKVVGNFTR